MSRNADVEAEVGLVAAGLAKSLTFIPWFSFHKLMERCTSYVATTLFPAKAKGWNKNNSIKYKNNFLKIAH